MTNSASAFTKGAVLCYMRTKVFVCYSYLAETPNACKEKVRELLDYMLTIEGEDEPRFVNIFLQ